MLGASQEGVLHWQRDTSSLTRKSCTFLSNIFLVYFTSTFHAHISLVNLSCTFLQLTNQRPLYLLPGLINNTLLSTSNFDILTLEVMTRSISYDISMSCRLKIRKKTTLLSLHLYKLSYTAFSDHPAVVVFLSPYTKTYCFHTSKETCPYGV